MSEKSLTHGIKFKDKIGYAMGDMGGLLTFSLIGAFQNKFYTDVLHIQPAKIVVLIWWHGFGTPSTTPFGARSLTPESPPSKANSARMYFGFPFRWRCLRC